MKMHKTWKFGDGQTDKQELAEIRAAQGAGLEGDYMRRQRYTRLLEGERERKRVVKAARAAYREARQHA